jgi:hypothetical protein
MYDWIILYNTTFKFRFNMKDICIVFMQKYLTCREQEGDVNEKLEIEREGRNISLGTPCLPERLLQTVFLEAAFCRRRHQY